jgi:hypothetical protein
MVEKSMHPSSSESMKNNYLNGNNGQEATQLPARSTVFHRIKNMIKP